MNRYIVLVSLVVWIWVSGCSGNGSPDTEFATAMPISDMNSSISMSIPATLGNSLDTHSDIEFEVINNSKYTVVFPFDYNVKLLIYTTNWESIGNGVNYFVNSGKSVTLAPYGVVDNAKGLIWNDFLLIYPILPNPNSKSVLRMAISGEKFDNGIASGQKVGAYYDVVLTP